MMSVSKGCTNKYSYGLSCTCCGECGRRFTKYGIDDRNVKSKKSDYENQEDLAKQILEIQQETSYEKSSIN